MIWNKSFKMIIKKKMRLIIKKYMIWNRTYKMILKKKNEAHYKEIND